MSHWELINYLAWITRGCPVDTSVVSLNLSNSRLSRIAVDIGLTTLTSKITNLPNLETINISHNNLTSIPVEIGMLGKLKNLDVSHNNLTSIPSAIGELPELAINFSHNMLTSVPETFKSKNRSKTNLLNANLLDITPDGLKQLLLVL